MAENFLVSNARMRVHQLAGAMPPGDPEALYSLGRLLHSLAGDAARQARGVETASFDAFFQGPAAMKWRQGVSATASEGSHAQSALMAAGDSAMKDGHKLAKALSDWAGYLQQAQESLDVAINIAAAQDRARATGTPKATR